MGIWDGEREVSSRVTWDQGGQDSTTQKEGFQVSKGGIGEGNWQRGLARGISRGLRLDLILLICVYVS